MNKEEPKNWHTMKGCIIIDDPLVVEETKEATDLDFKNWLNDYIDRLETTQPTIIIDNSKK